jgi:type II secretion system protein H
MQTADRNKESGFTLVEILLAILIMGLMALIAVALYHSSARRFSLQNEAIGLAMRLEQAKTLAQSQSTEYRIVFNSDSYTPQYIDHNHGDSDIWFAAESISARSINLNPKISYYDPASGPQPASGPIETSPDGQSATPPVQSTEIRFNSRGFPVEAGSPPTHPRQENAVYLTDGDNLFAVTVNILGRIQVWAYKGSVWVAISN